MVEAIYWSLEWGLLPPPTVVPAQGRGDHRRLWNLGVWGMAPGQVVSGAMGREVSAPVNSREGTDPNSASMRNVGWLLAWPASSLLL